MRRVRINPGFAGLVFKGSAFVRVLKEGKYWISPFEEIVIKDMAKPFASAVELNIMLRDKALAEMLEIVEVNDNEIVLQFEDGLFKGVLVPGKYAFWKGVISYSFKHVNLNEKDIPEGFDIELLQRPELLKYTRIYTVGSNEKAILFSDGKFETELDPGVYTFWRNSKVLSVLKADLRKQQLEVTGQEILTKNKAGLRVNFFAQYRIVDIQKALVDSKDSEKQLYVLMQLALREYIGMYTLDELLEKKESVADRIMENIVGKAEDLGIEVFGCGIRDVILPGEVKEIMNQVLVAEKRAQANIITRREETASTRSLLNTAKLMEDNSMLLKLKEMEYVEKIADKINSISLSGGNQVVDQLKGLFSPVK